MSEGIRPPAVDPETVPARTGSNYPAPFRAAVEARSKRRLGDALGLTQFGVNLVLLPPGTASSQRHWHTHEDEFIYVVEGELTLVTDGGEQILGPGMAAGFPAGRPDGHRLINRGTVPATYLEVGTRSPEDEATYSDIDMRLKRTPAGRVYVNGRGEPY